MKLKPHQRVPLDVAEARALSALSEDRPLPAQWVADAIWPDHQMKPQGAGAAASRIMKRLEKRGLCHWKFVAYVGQGWVKARHPRRAST